MPTYVFVGRNQLNQQVRGERTAASREQLESLLRREQVTLLSVQEKAGTLPFPNWSVEASARRSWPSSHVSFP